MTTPLHKTFDLLGSTTSSGAVDVLVAALDLEPDVIRLAAVRAIIQRDTLRGQVEIISRMPCLGEEACQAIIEHAHRMHAPLRHCLLHGEVEARRRALDVVQAAESYDQLDALLEVLQRPDDELRADAIEALVALMQQLYQRWASKRRDMTVGGRKVGDIRYKVLSQLDQSCSDFAKLAAREEVLTAILALGDPEHFAVKKVLSQVGIECRELATRLLMTSRHPGVMQLICDSMGKNYPLGKMFDAIQGREDLPFAEQLLSWYPRKPTQLQQKNLRQVESMAWLRPDHPVLEQLDGALQTRLVEFLAALGLPANDKRDLQEWLVRHGPPEARLAASSILSSLDKPAAQQIIFNSLNSEDEEIQAWATSQLRDQKIPETFSILIERLESPLPAVRQAAREELRSFDIETMLGIFEHLEPETCHRAGELILKIDPDCPDKMCRELAAPIRRKRIRAARACRLMGLHEHVVPALLVMLEDSDSLVRRTALEVLEGVSAPEVRTVVRLLTEDPSPRVREAAVKTLQTLGQNAATYPM